MTLAQILLKHRPQVNIKSWEVEVIHCECGYGHDDIGFNWKRWAEHVERAATIKDHWWDCKCEFCV